MSPYLVDPQRFSKILGSRATVALCYWYRIPTRSVESLEVFRFYGTHSDFQTLAWIFAGSLLRFHTLTVVSGRIQYDSVPETTETWKIAARFPAGLRSIKPKYVFVPWETCLTGHLIDLDPDYSQTAEEVPIPMSSFMELLALCTRLETLRLNYAGPETQDENLAHFPGVNPVHLTNLRIFEIFDDPLNIAYIMNNLKLPDTTRIRVEPSIGWPEQLVNFTFPSETRVSPTDGLIEWNVGQGSSLSIGTTEFIYHVDVDDEEFMEAFRLTFHSPFLEFVEFSTDALTALELDFDLEFEPDQEVWFAVLAVLPALRRLSCISKCIISHHFAPRFFTELGRGSHGGIHCPRIRELDLSKFDLHEMEPTCDIILRVLREREKAGIRIEKLTLWHKCFETLDFDSLRMFGLCVTEVLFPRPSMKRC